MRKEGVQLTKEWSGITARLLSLPLFLIFKGSLVEQNLISEIPLNKGGIKGGCHSGIIIFMLYYLDLQASLIPISQVPLSYFFEVFG